MSKGPSRLFRVIVLDWIPVFVYIAAVLYVSSQSRLPGGLVLMSPYDKLGHFVQYFVLGLLLARASRATLPNSSGAWPWLLGIAIGLGIGAGDERLQASVPGRFCSTYDWLADAAGIIAAQSVLWLAQARGRRAPAVERG